MPPETLKSARTAPPKQAGPKLWLQILIVLLLALLAQVVGLWVAYLLRCKPPQGNDWCGVDSVGAALLGSAVAVCLLIGGTIVILLRRNSGGAGGRVGPLRILAITFGLLLTLPCGWMLGFGWRRTHSDGGLWLGMLLGLTLIASAFLRRRRLGQA